MNNWKYKLTLATVGTLIVAIEFWFAFSHVAACLHLGGEFGSCGGDDFGMLYVAAFIWILVSIFTIVSTKYARTLNISGILSFSVSILIAVSLMSIPPFVVSKIDFTFLTKGSSLEHTTYNSQSNQQSIRYITDCSDFMTGRLQCIQDFLTRTGSTLNECDLLFGDEKSACWWSKMHTNTSGLQGFATVTPAQCIAREYSESAHSIYPLINCVSAVAQVKNDVSACNALLRVKIHNVKPTEQANMQIDTYQKCVSNFNTVKW